MNTTTAPTAAIVGEFATYGIGSDRYAVEIIAVSASGQTVTVRDADVIQNGPDAGTAAINGDQVGTFTVAPNLFGEVKKFRRYDIGGRVSYRGKGGHGYLTFGAVTIYRDPSF